MTISCVSTLPLADRDSAGDLGSRRTGLNDLCRMALLCLAVTVGDPAVAQASPDPGASLTDADWQTLRERRILFGHQSVGGNVLDGARALAEAANADLPLIESRDLSDAGPGIVHFRVGENGSPQSKLDDFARVLESQKDLSADVALVKLCYVDVKGQTDAAALAQAYGDAIERWSERWPSTTFVAVTVPLKTAESRPKVLAKKLLGRLPGGKTANERRQEINDNLRQRFASRGQLFDLARIEAAGLLPADASPGSPEALDPRLTNDGGHLNELGARLVAAELLRLLAQMPGSPGSEQAGAN